MVSEAEALRDPAVIRALSLPRPRWRGVTHRWAFFASLPIGVLVVATAPSLRAALGVATFAFGVAAMFGISALVHLKPWCAVQYHWLFKLDHTGIFLMIATGVTPLAILGAGGRAGWTLFTVMWAGALLGIATVWMPFHPPRGLMNTMFIGLGWTAILMMPWIWRGVGAWPTIWVLVGGFIFTVGAFVVGSQRPNPNPEVFGYHEIWHLCVIAAITVHYLVVALELRPRG